MRVTDLDALIEGADNDLGILNADGRNEMPAHFAAISSGFGVFTLAEDDVICPVDSAGAQLHRVLEEIWNRGR